MIEVWGRVSSLNVQKVMWAMAEMDLDWQRHDVGGPWGGNNDPAFVAMNPNRLVPVVRDGDLVLWESNACTRHLCARYGEGGLWPVDPDVRAVADMWMDWVATALSPALREPFIQLIRTRPDERDMAAVERSVRRLDELFRMLDAHLEGRSWVAGNGLTVGDIPSGVATYRYFNMNIARPELPNVTRWYVSLTERSAFRTHVMVPLT